MAEVSLTEPRNLKHDTAKEKQNILLVGGVGPGKTTQFRTLPGKKFAYIFDPNATQSLKGSDIDVVEFIPDWADLDMTIKPLSAQRPRDKSEVRSKIEPTTYLRWETDFEERLRTGFFEKYDWISFDSITTLGDLIMDRVLFLNGRLGKHPEQADYTAQMEAMRSIFRAATEMGHVFATAHTELQQDELTRKIYGRILITGKNRIRVPMLFSQIFALDSENGKFFAITIRDRENPVVRTTIKGLKEKEDITIDFTKPVEGQGIARLLKDVL